MHQFLKFILEMKLYKFRTVPLYEYIIRSFSLYTQRWYMSYRFVDSFPAGSGWNAVPSWSCCCRLYRHITLGSNRVPRRKWFKHSTWITQYTMTAVKCKIQSDFRYTTGFNITHIVFIKLLHLLLNRISFWRKVFKLHSFLGTIN
jgi:hypothetical protein